MYILAIDITAFLWTWFYDADLANAQKRSCSSEFKCSCKIVSLLIRKFVKNSYVNSENSITATRESTIFRDVINEQKNITIQRVWLKIIGRIGKGILQNPVLFLLACRGFQLRTKILNFCTFYNYFRSNLLCDVNFALYNSIACVGKWHVE